MTTDILLETGTNELEIVEFYIEKSQGVKEYFGINVIKVQEIIRYPEITRIPAKPHPCFLGLIRLREKIMPLLDLGIYLYNIPLDSNGKVIVTEFNRMKIGFLVSGLTRIHRISWQDVAPPVEIEYEGKTPCITGVVKFDDRIVFTLDVEKIVGEMAPMFLEEGIITEEHAKKRYKVLIADDSPTVRNMLVVNLKDFDIHVAKNGQEAWDYLVDLKQGQEDIFSKCNLVISDIEMPQMDGFTLTKKIKEDPILNKIPVILFSSMITDKILHKGQSVGADDQISKPEIGDLAKKALQLIEKTQN
ncbi:chemotaxis protein [Desulfothermus naphthae]